jgi:hypothetical protein
LEQIANLLFLDEGMPQGQLWLDLVVVSSPPSLARHIALIDEIGKDLVGAALRDADGAGNVAQADSGVISDAQQDVGVVREEVPMPRYWSRRRFPLFSRISIHESMLLCFVDALSRKRALETDSPCAPRSNPNWRHDGAAAYIAPTAIARLAIPR